MDSKRKGEISESIIVSEMLKKGYNVSVPFGENTRYDLIIDKNGQLEKVQCKTGRLKKGVIKFNTVSTRSNYSETREINYEGEIDKFVVYCPDLERIFEVPEEKAPNGEMKLRVEEPANNQKKGINWAEDYELRSEA